eukprot:gene1958-2576_t
MSIVTCTIDDNVRSIISFPQGVPDEDLNFAVKLGEKSKEKEEHKRKRQVVGDLNGITFRGTDFGENSWRKDSCKYAIGILDEKSGTMRICAVDHAYVMRMTPKDNENIAHLTEI